jgi:hypothetical protein
MKKQTAVEWIVNVVNSCIAPDYIPKEIIEQAKEMEKEQIKDTASAYYHENTKLTPTQYYNETYGGDK